MAQPSTLPPLVRNEWIPMDWDTFIAWSSEEGKFERVDGRGIAHGSNSDPHGRITVFLTQLMGTYVRVLDLDRLFVDLMLLRLPSRPSGRMPDLFVVGKDDLDRVRHQWVEGAALLAVEILSEDSVARDQRDKRAEYEAEGIPEYLTVDARPGRDGVTFLRLDGEGSYRPVEPDGWGRYRSTALPGFWFDPAWFGQDPPPRVEDLLMAIAPDAYEAYLMTVIRARRAGEAPR